MKSKTKSRVYLLFALCASLLFLVVGALFVNFMKSEIPLWLQLKIEKKISEQLKDIDGLTLTKVRIYTSPWHLIQLAPINLELILSYTPLDTFVHISGTLALDRSKSLLTSELFIRLKVEKNNPIEIPLSIAIQLSGDPVQQLSNTDWKSLQAQFHIKDQNFKEAHWSNLGGVIEGQKEGELSIQMNFDQLSWKDGMGVQASASNGKALINGSLTENAEFYSLRMTTEKVHLKSNEYSCGLPSLSIEAKLMIETSNLNVQTPGLECSSEDETLMLMVDQLEVLTDLSNGLANWDKAIQLKSELRLASIEYLYDQYYGRHQTPDYPLFISVEVDGDRVGLSANDRNNTWAISSKILDEKVEATLITRDLSLKQLQSLSPIELPMKINSGTLNFDGSLAITKALNWRADAKINNLSASYEGGPLPIDLQWTDSQIHLDSQKKTKSQIQGLKAQQMGRSLLDTVELRFDIEPQWKISLGSPLRLLGNKIQIDHFDMNSHNSQWKVDVSGQWDKLLLSRLSRDYCLTPVRIPPLTLKPASWSAQLSPDQFRLDGAMEVQTFGGQIEIQDIRIYRPLSQFPESQLSLSWSDIDLRHMGRWTGIGAMEGDLNGHLKNLVLQGSLPTQFEFYLSADPPKGARQVIFSPPAMKNVVGLLTPEDFAQNLPGFVNWMAFGPPSYLLGGFNIDYAGAKIIAKDGRIILYTLDPEPVSRASVQRHLLHGPRFKIPVKSSVYPVVMDAQAMAGFVSHIKLQLQSLLPNNEEDNTELPIKEATDVSGCPSFLFN